MKIRKFIAPDMSRALRMVREELGADAVILSNRKEGRQIELIAASEYDPALFEASRKEVESLVGEPVDTVPPAATDEGQALARRASSAVAREDPSSESKPSRPARVVTKEPVATSVRHLEERARQDSYGEIQRELHAMRALLDQQLQEWGRERLVLREPKRAQWVDQLVQAGFDPALARALTRQVDAGRSAEAGWHDVLVRLSQQLPVVQRDLQPGMGICLVGGPGAGKTTTLIKLASRFVMQFGASRLRLVSMDHQRLGARAQMEALAAILGVPLQTVIHAEDLPPSPEADMLTLVDTPAMPRREAELRDYTRWLGFRPGWRHWLVLPAHLQAAALQLQLDLLSSLEPECIVLTQMDHAPRLGEVLSILMQQRLPLAWVSDGPQIPEDLARARAARLVVRAMDNLSQRSVHPPAQSLYTGTETG